jgi:hypothetical protein
MNLNQILHGRAGHTRNDESCQPIGRISDIARVRTGCGSTAHNRGQAARVAWSSHVGRRPRRLMPTPGTGKASSSWTDQR